MLQKLMGGELDLLVAPLSCPVLARDQAHSMDAPEVAVDECVPGLRIVGRTVGEPEMPAGVVVPRVRLQEGILVPGARLNVSPHAFEHVLVGVDQASSLRQSVLVERVRGHEAHSGRDRDRRQTLCRSAYAAATLFGTTIAQASITSSRISTASIAASRTTAQL
jgi:hypothetical protein